MKPEPRQTRLGQAMARPMPTTVISIVDKQSHDMKERKTLQTLQVGAGKDKENLVGNGRLPQSSTKDMKPEKEFISEKNNMDCELLSKKTATHAKKKQKKMPKEKTQITEEDLTSETPNENYWSIVAEKRRLALEEALEENMRLHEKIALLEEETATQKTMLAETTGVIELLREMLGEDCDTSLMSVSDISQNEEVNDSVEDPDVTM